MLRKEAHYEHENILIKEQNVLLIEDLDDCEDCPSVTNTIEQISKKLNCKKILYKDSMGIWSFWDGTFHPIIVGETIYDTQEAITALENSSLL